MAKWSWLKLRHENYGNGSRYYGDCQVVTAVNAYHILTGKIAYKDQAAYRRLCKMAGAVHGSATSIEKIWNKLGIETYKHSFDMPKRIVNPIEATVWHKRYGFHSVLIVERNERCRAVRITNFREESSSEGWIFEEDLNHFKTANMDKMEPRWWYRSFRLRRR